MAKESLTPKQQAFVAAYLKTGNASEAYRQAYSASKMKPETVWKNAHALLNHTKVSTRLAELRRESRQSVKITLKEHLETLQSLREKAVELGQVSAAVKAEESRGKASGIYTAAEEDEKAISGMSKDELLKELADINATLARYAPRLDGD